MRAAHRNYYRRRGAAMVVLAVIIILGLIAFGLQKMGVFAPHVTDPNQAGIMPWKEWEIRQMNESLEPGIYGEVPNVPLLTSLLSPDDVETGKGRGQVTLNFNAGEIFCKWHGSYHTEEKKLVDIVNAESFGRIYCDKKYVDENGNEDPSKMWFISAGDFALLQSGKMHVKNMAGEMYVCGWLGEDNTVEGSIFITSNRKYYQEFKFDGKARTPKF